MNPSAGPDVHRCMGSLSDRIGLGALRAHIWPLGCVAVACLIGQASVLFQTSLVAWRSDSSSYAQVAENILQRFQFIDALRTPGYPTFLALLFAMAGGEHLPMVVFAQTGLILSAVAEVYVLAFRVANNRWQAAVVAGLTGASPFVASWERCILPEALSFWLVVTLFLILERYLREHHSTDLIWLACLMVANILTRPQYLYLPIVLGAILGLRALRRRRPDHVRREFMVVVAVPLVFVICYSAANAVTTGYFGLSDVTNINFFGKVVEYHMYDMSGAESDPMLAQFRRDFDQSAASWDPSAAAHDSWVHQSVSDHVWSFVVQHPEYDANHRAIYGTFSRAMIFSHPIAFLSGIPLDIVASAYAGPQVSADYTYIPPWLDALFVVFAFFSRIYVFLPIMAIGQAIVTWKRADRASELVLFALLLAVAGNVLLIGLTDFAEFWRVRFPTDWCMTMVFVILMVSVTRASARTLAGLTERVSKSMGR